MRFLALLPLAALLAAPAPKTDPAELSKTAKMLASDAFEGRAPGTPGEAKTVAYLTQRLKALGLEPGGEKGSFIQRVPMIHTRIGTGTMAFGATALSQGKEVAVTTVRPAAHIRIAGAPMV